MLIMSFFYNGHVSYTFCYTENVKFVYLYVFCYVAGGHDFSQLYRTYPNQRLM